MAGTDDGYRVASSTHDGSGHDLRDHSIGELLKRLAEDASALVRQEVELAKTEMTEKGKTVGKGAGMLGAAGIVGLLAAGTLTAFLVLVLAEAMPAWLAALLIGAIYAIVAAVLALRGKKQLQAATPPVPEQTIESVKEDVQWLKNRN